MSRRPVATLALTSALAVVLGGVLAACGSDESGDERPRPDATPSSSQTPSPPTATELSFGEAGSVTWRPTGDVSGELSIRVDRVREGRPADFEGLRASGITRENQPFYADVVIVNEGEADLGGLDVPLYLADSSETLSPPSRFASTFGPCPSGPLPEVFAAGDELETCLVFVGSPGASLAAITFQPTVDSAAVSWTGEVAAAASSGEDRLRQRRTKRR